MEETKLKEILEQVNENHHETLKALAESERKDKENEWTAAWDKQFLTQEKLKEVLHYDKDTGKWTWLVSKGGMSAGTEAGTINHHGYRIITIDGKLYPSSRLACFYMTGSFPKNEVDHINRNKLDDRWENLRNVSHTLNQQNRGIQKNNTSGHPGVSWNESKKKWMSYIKIDGKLINLGWFDSLADAVETRKTHEKQYYEGKVEQKDKDREFTLSMAEVVWERCKGYPIPDCYSEEDRLGIFERYYHRAVSQSQGE